MQVNKPINVALSGSGFLFPMHIGALQALSTNGVMINGYSGTSGGALVAAAASVGYTPEQMLEIVEELDLKSMLKFNISALFDMALCRGREVERSLKLVFGDKTLADVEHPLYIIATDLNYGTGVVLSKKNYPDMPIWLAVRASMAIPFLYTPVRYRGMVLVDGMLYNSIPISVFDDSVLKSIGFQLTSKPSTAPYFTRVRYIPSIILRIYSILLRNMDRMHFELSELNSSSEIVFIDRCGYDSLDVELSSSDIRFLAAEGYKVAVSRGLPFLN